MLLTRNLRGKYLAIEVIRMIGKTIEWLESLIKPRFMEWDDYKKKINFIDDFYFQQSCRKQSIRNLP